MKIRSRTMTEKKKITVSAMSKAIEQDVDTLAATADEERIMKDVMSTINAKRKTVRPSRPKRKYWKSAIAIVACATLIAAAVTGGLMDNLNTMTQNTDPGVQSNTTQDTPNTSGQKVHEDTKMVEKEVTVSATEEPKADTGNTNETVSTGEITLTGGDCDCGHVNPDKAILKNADPAQAPTWTIEKKGSGKVVHKGSGTTITSQLKSLYKNEKKGNYMITFSYKDKNENKIKVYKVFTIDPTTITPGTYE